MVHKPLTFAFSSCPDHYSSQEIQHLDFISQYTTDIKHSLSLVKTTSLQMLCLVVLTPSQHCQLISHPFPLHNNMTKSSRSYGIHLCSNSKKCLCTLQRVLSLVICPLVLHELTYCGNTITPTSHDVTPDPTTAPSETVHVEVRASHDENISKLCSNTPDLSTCTHVWVCTSLFTSHCNHITMDHTESSTDTTSCSKM